MVLREAQNLLCFASVSQIYKFKRPIQTVEHHLHIEISLEIKIYIFLNFFYYFLDGYKIVSFCYFTMNHLPQDLCMPLNSRVQAFPSPSLLIALKIRARLAF
jgi:hypothetical protein